MADDLTRRMPVESGRGELDLLAIALNAMLDRINRLVENLRHISVGIARPLRFGPECSNRRRRRTNRPSIETCPVGYRLEVPISVAGAGTPNRPVPAR